MSRHPRHQKELPEEKAIFKYLRFVFKQWEFSKVVFNVLSSVVELFLTKLVHIRV